MRSSTPAADAGHARRLDRHLGAFVVAACAATYWATLLPGVGFSGDTAEFQFIGRVLGVPHPTGYPTYVLLNGLFVRIVPFGSLAFRANLLSAILAVATVFLVFRICRGRVPHPEFAAVAALLFAWSPIFWSQAVVAEVYTLNAFFVALVILLLLKWRQSRSTRHLLLACACYAFSFGNHLTMITFLPAMLYLVLATDPGISRRGRVVAVVVAVVVVAASQYLVLMWRSRDPETAFVWRGAGTWRSLWTLVSGAQFRKSMFAFTFEEVLTQRIPMYASLFWEQFRWSTPLIVLGAIRHCRRTEGVFLLIGLVGNLFFALNYWIGDIGVYFIPSFLIAAMWFAEGCRMVRARIPGPESLRRSFSVAVWLIPGLQLMTHWADVDRSQDTELAAQTEHVLEEARGEGLLVTNSWMKAAALWYYVLGERCCADSVHIANTPGAGDVARYVRGEERMWLPATRHELFTRLSVYALDESFVARLQGQGLYLFPVSDDLYAVRAEATLGATLGRKHGLSAEMAPVDRAVEYLDGWKPLEHWGRWVVDPRPTIVFSSYHPPAELVIHAAPWREMGDWRVIRVLLGGSELARFRLAGEYWRMQEFVVPLPGPLDDALVTLEIQDSQGEVVPESEAYSLPVGGIWLRPAGGAKEDRRGSS